MTMRPGSFRADELVGADVELEDAEVAQVAATAEVIERSTPSDSLQPTVDFTGRVMAALASEPTQSPVRSTTGLRCPPARTA